MGFKWAIVTNSHKLGCFTAVGFVSYVGLLGKDHKFLEFPSANQPRFLHITELSKWNLSEKRFVKLHEERS